MKTETRQLRFDQMTVVDLPFQVLENAFWRPQAAKLHGKHRESLKSVSEPRADKTYQKLRLAWRREETWINHALNALLASVPDKSLGSLMGKFSGGGELDAPRVAKLDSAGIASTTGDPDFIVMGEQACVLGESKVAAQPSSHRYSFQQFTKYQVLGAILSCSWDPTVRRHSTHLLVVPEVAPEKFCTDYSQWRPQVDDGRLTVDANALKVRDPKGRFSDFKTWRAFVRRSLLDKRVLSRCELDPAKVERLLASESPALVPTYVVTWTEMLAAVQAEAERTGLRNLGLAAGKLERMAYGQPPADSASEAKERFVAQHPVVFT